MTIANATTAGTSLTAGGAAEAEKVAVVAADAGDKGAAGAGAAGAAGAAETKVAAVTPPAEIELKFGEGVQIDESLVKDFKPLAKELGLDSSKAQKIADLYTKAASAAEAKRSAAEEAKRSGWAEASANHKEFGGAKFKENLGIAFKALEKFGSKELNTALDESGLGNHPAVIGAFYKIGKAIAEDSIAGTQNGGSSGAKDRNAALRERYPTMFKE